MDQWRAKWIVITGGAGGIGRATARLFLESGASVLLVDRDQERLVEVAAALSDLGEVRTAVSELADPAGAQQALDDVNGPLYALVHLAGVLERDPLHPASLVIWERAIQSNLASAYNMAISFLRRRQGPTRIVFASSTAYRRGGSGYAAYSAAKGGVVGLTRALSREFAPDVLVNAVAPGIIETPMTSDLLADVDGRMERMRQVPLQRFGRPEEVGSVIRFLCSSDASYITGQTITVDGGVTNS